MACCSRLTRELDLRFGRGRVFMFAYQFFLNTIIAAIVLLSVAGTVTDVIAFYCMPNGHSRVRRRRSTARGRSKALAARSPARRRRASPLQVLETHRRVKVDKKAGFAELGIRMANADVIALFAHVAPNTEVWIDD